MDFQNNGYSFRFSFNVLKEEDLRAYKVLIDFVKKLSFEVISDATLRYLV